jgi:hypothetical protein
MHPTVAQVLVERHQAELRRQADRERLARSVARLADPRLAQPGHADGSARPDGRHVAHGVRSAARSRAGSGA